MPARLELVELLDEDAGVDDAAGADHALLAPEDPRRACAGACRSRRRRRSCARRSARRCSGRRDPSRWASRSTILPLPSSPHWAPTITVAGTRGVCHATRCPLRLRRAMNTAPPSTGPGDLAGCHHAQPGDATDADPMSAPAGGEADVRLGRSDPSTTRGLDRPRPGGAPPGTLRTERRTRSRPRRARSPDGRPCSLPPHAARSANLAKRRRKLSLTMSVGPFRCFARCTSASPCWSDSSPL